MAPVGDDGDTVADHMASVERQIAVEEVDSLHADAPVMPPELDYLWAAFVDMDHARGGSGFGANPISFTELAAWCAATRTPLEPWEARAIRAVDKVYIAQRAKE